MTSVLLALSMVGAIELECDEKPITCFPETEDCVVEVINFADCIELPYDYAAGDTFMVYWKDCFGAIFAHDYLPNDEWDYAILVDEDCNEFRIENSGNNYTTFEVCGDWCYAFFYKDCDIPPPPEVPEPTSALIWGLLGLLYVARRKR